jgi:hypothetical protein
MPRAGRRFGCHSYATWRRRYAGRDLRGLMDDGGWKSINSVVRYAHVVAGETAAAVDRLPMVQIRAKSVQSERQSPRVELPAASELDCPIRRLSGRRITKSPAQKGMVKPG